jgi:VIT1/CCC1 family predicted Fe2+/Mn2+ transporter
MSDEHGETHRELSPSVRDIIIGMSDGLTVPFAIAAGLASAATTSTTIIIAAVLSEIAAGSISMGLGGYLAADTEAEHYASELAREEREVREVPHIERKEVADFFKKFGMTDEEVDPVVNSLTKRKEAWIDFMMRFELGLEKPDKRRALKSAVTIAGAYVVGGFIPLTPYIIFRSDPSLAFTTSVVVMFIALVIFGYLRGRVMGQLPLRSIIQTVLVGAIAATAAFLLAKLVP